jgi:hypothetical protein
LPCHYFQLYFELEISLFSAYDAALFSFFISLIRFRLRFDFITPLIRCRRQMIIDFRFAPSFAPRERPRQPRSAYFTQRAAFAPPRFSHFRHYADSRFIAVFAIFSFHYLADFHTLSRFSFISILPLPISLIFIEDARFIRVFVDFRHASQLSRRDTPLFRRRRRRHCSRYAAGAFLPLPMSRWFRLRRCCAASDRPARLLMPDYAAFFHQAIIAATPPLSPARIQFSAITPWP